MSKAAKSITWFLGVSMTMFGFLKFFNPFKSWYTTQVVAGGLPFTQLSYWAGQLGEMTAGATLIYLLLAGSSVTRPTKRWLFTGAHLAIIAMMAVAVYVHLQPEVPAEVLPMKIKPPFIPGLFAVLAAVNLGLKEVK